MIVAYENQVAMEETLERGLQRLFGGDVAGGPVRTTADAPAAAPPERGLAGLAQEASERYEAALAAQRVGDWARYGEEMRLVGELLTQLRARTRAGGT